MHKWLKLTKPRPVQDDRELAARLVRGDEEAFDEFYRCLSTRLFSLALRLSANRSQAEDMTQEIFLHLLRKIHLYNGEASLSTWSYRVAVNFFISQLRRTRRDGNLVHLDQLEAGPAVPAALQQQEPPLDRFDLEKGLAALPPGYREVLILHDVEGHPHQEIAALLGIAEGTSKSQLHHARLRIREFLQGGNHAVQA